ncbi:hypothetical protein GCM10010405_09550 [Streptomyces macrosporus]|uniref:Uncharacterized protein n=1 Tax=Streptomyces macrosporus TaxID=44032 RepID=A0ABP5WMY1_9ACTN
MRRIAGLRVVSDKGDAPSARADGTDARSDARDRRNRFPWDRNGAMPALIDEVERGRVGNGGTGELGPTSSPPSLSRVPLARRAVFRTSRHGRPRDAAAHG